MASSMFARRHYVEVARLLANAGYLDADQHRRLCADLVALFADDNSAFDPERFRAAASLHHRADLAVR